MLKNLKELAGRYALIKCDIGPKGQLLITPQEVAVCHAESIHLDKKEVSIVEGGNEVFPMGFRAVRCVAPPLDQIEVPEMLLNMAGTFSGLFGGK